MKQAVLRENKDFRTLYYRGTSRVSPTLIVFARKNRCQMTRIGITTGKKVGIAVKRSRCRRIIRAAFRTLSPRVKPGYDLVFVARAKTAEIKSTELTPVMERLLIELGVIAG